MEKKDYIWFAVLIAAVIVYTLFVEWRKKRKTGAGTHVYDERQKAARSLAFRVAFVVLAASSILMGFLRYLFGTLPMDFFTQEVFCVLLSMLVWVVICIWNDAWMPLRKDLQKVLRGVWGGMLIFGSNAWITRDEMVIDGQLTLAVLPWVVVVTGCTVLLTYYLRQAVNRRKEKVEEDA